jgi:DNA mismatch repair protein MutL
MSATGRVAILPDDVANQIAAGEVVERPASVVKELVENALDAGATRITVDVVDAGRALLRIVDDGSGMGRDDAATAILRHATSKLRSADDLHAIETLGFRGEALPSIASVSRFELVTQRAEDEVGTRIVIEGGGAPVISEAGAPVGTRIEVADLFFNVPARRKFLKSDATELAQIQQVMTAFALGYPHVHFRMTSNERTTLDYPSVKQLRDRAVQVLGRELTRRLYDVHGDSNGIGVVGFVSAPSAAKSHANQIHLFVNGRRVRDRNLHHALVSAYGADLGPGRFPQAILYLHLSPQDVDVNVHPAKAEVRFAHPAVVHQVLHLAVRRTLERRPWQHEAPLPLEKAAREAVAEPQARYQPSLADFEKPLPVAVTTAPLPLDLPPRAAGFGWPAGVLKVPAQSLQAQTSPDRLPSHVNVSPDMPLQSNVSPGIPLQSNVSTDMSLQSNVSPGMPLQSNVSPGMPLQPGTSREAHAASDTAGLPATPPPSATPATPSGHHAPMATNPSRDSTPAAPPHHRVGTLIDGRLVLEREGVLLIADPRLMARDLLHHQLLSASSHGPIPTKPMVMPVMIDLAPRAAKALKARLHDLAPLGVWIESFGGTAFQILGLPTPLAGAPARDLALSLATLFERSPSAPSAHIMALLADIERPQAAALDPDAIFDHWSRLPEAARRADACRHLPLAGPTR